MPRTLTGRIMLVTAIAVLLVQGINATIRFQALQARAVVDAASHLAATISSQMARIESENDELEWRKRRVWIVISDTPIQPVGFRSTNELAERVAAPLRSINPQVQSVRLSIGSIDNLPPSLGPANAFRDRLQPRWDPVKRDKREVLLLTLKMEDGRWVHATFGIRPNNIRPFAFILAETLLIYFGVLIPLLLVIRQMSKPLRQLDERLATEGLAGGAPPLEPRGPDDVRKLIESFNAAEQRVNSMLTEKDVMLGAIGHDLKTPLASLRVRIESVEDESERSKMADTIDEMVHILDDILILARLGKSAEQPVLTEIGALVEMVADEFGGEDRVTIIASEEKCRAMIRPVLLRRALRNLIDNAVQYGTSAELTTRCDGDQVRVVIDDSGPGVNPVTIPLMFEPFARAETSRNRASGGSGLGLTIARAIARAHGGDVSLENRPEGGLRAILTISQKPA